MNESKVLIWFRNFIKKIRIKLLPESIYNEKISEEKTIKNEVIKEGVIKGNKREIDAFDYVSNFLENDSSYHELLKINDEINEYKHEIRKNLDKINENFN